MAGEQVNPPKRDDSVVRNVDRGHHRTPNVKKGQRKGLRIKSQSSKRKMEGRLERGNKGSKVQVKLVPLSIVFQGLMTTLSLVIIKSFRSGLE